jgi:hypothetical protein
MASLSNQLGPHNKEWFKESQKYWHRSVFGLHTDKPDQT